LCFERQIARDERAVRGSGCVSHTPGPMNGQICRISSQGPQDRLLYLIHTYTWLSIWLQRPHLKHTHKSIWMAFPSVIVVYHFDCMSYSFGTIFSLSIKLHAFPKRCDFCHHVSAWNTHPVPLLSYQSLRDDSPVTVAPVVFTMITVIWLHDN
jgi:hypothetical protein